MRSSFINFLFTVPALFLLLNGCSSGSGTPTGNPAVKECALPDDQIGTLTGRWRNPPVPIAFHEGDFSAEEITAMMRAVNTWNKFYAQSLSLRPLDYGGDLEKPRMSALTRTDSNVLCGQSIVQKGESDQEQFISPVVIYKDYQWPFAGQNAAMAITSYCRNTLTKPLATFFIASMELNYQYFFVQGKRLPDLETIVLHEFGHLLGLNHSCEVGSEGNGIPNCTDGSLPPEYHAALMFPIFEFDKEFGYYGEKKRKLTTNDQGRANCLYSK